MNAGNTINFSNCPFLTGYIMLTRSDGERKLADRVGTTRKRFTLTRTDAVSGLLATERECFILAADIFSYFEVKVADDRTVVLEYSLFKID